MKKIISKFWGVALVVMMLSSLFIVTAPAAAAPYAFAADATALPTMSAAGFSIVDVAQSGDVIYASATVTAGTDYIYKSADGGAIWAPTVAAGLVAGTWNLVAVAPDDPDIVAVVDTAATPDVVYLSITGGATFAAITPLGAGTALNGIDISGIDPVSGFRSIAVAGSNVAPAVDSAGGYLATWEIGNFAAAWTVPVDTAPASIPVTDDIMDVAFSSNYEADQALVYVGIEIGGVAGTGAASVALHVYSWQYVDYDADVDLTYPRVLSSGALPTTVLTCANADIVLDDLFSILDNELGFIGAQITNAAAEAGNVFRINTVSATLSPINAVPIAINSVAWDGVNLLAAPYQLAAGVITIYRSSVAATTVGLTPSNLYKTPGTGTLPIVFWAGADGYAVSQGNNACVARTTDLGKSFNGVALFNSTLADVTDFWISSDASVMYAVTDDAVGAVAGDIMLWRKAGGVWERVLLLAAKLNENWVVRAADSDPTAVMMGRLGAKNMLRSLDGGDFIWTPKNSTQNIADFAVQSGTVAYVASSTSGAVIKTSGATWASVGALPAGNFGYNIALIADNSFVVGGTAGGVGYYNGTVWATVAAVPVTGLVGNTLVAANGTATGDTIYAASASGVGTFTVGTSAAFTTPAAPLAATGLAYAGGVFYAFLDNTPVAGGTLYRYLAAPDLVVAAATNFDNSANVINALKATTGSVTLWARDSAATDSIFSFTEFLLLATPSLTYPVAPTIIPVNSLNGATNPFIFQWVAPAGITGPAGPGLGWTYTVSVFFDAAGTIAVPPAIAGTNTVALTNISSNIWGAGAASPFVAGETYYWRVQITAPITSLASAMGTFTVQQLEAVVPVIDSPPNGSNVASLTPAFSWGPISGVTKYEFQIAKEPEFALMVYTANSSTSSAALPVATQLEDGETYFWRVRAIEPAVGEWSQVGIFTVAVPVTPPVTVTPTVTATTTTTVITTPTIIIPTTTQAPVEKISPAYIWAIIIIGAVLVIAVIVLIVRTRRTV